VLSPLRLHCRVSGSALRYLLTVKLAIQPILILPVYRGGERFRRALDSIPDAEKFFRRIVISLNCRLDSEDRDVAENFVESNSSKAEIVCTEEELPWMEHQHFWIDYLEQTGVKSSDWIYWFAHDDEIRATGIAALVDGELNWPLVQGFTYLGPWGMRHEKSDQLFEGSRNSDIEFWTSFPISGPTQLPVAEWISQQMIQPTYINMSGCVTQLRSFQALREFRIPKPGGMRIEMAIAAGPQNKFVAEFREPVVITYGRANSDRAQYNKVARQDDKHIILWLTNYSLNNPRALLPLTRAGAMVGYSYLLQALGRRELPREDWRVRGEIRP
jgi:hypothetical protein